MGSADSLRDICLAAKAMRQFLARYTLKIGPRRRGGCLKRWLTLALDSIEYLSDLRTANAFNWNVRRLRHYKLFLLRN